MRAYPGLCIGGPLDGELIEQTSPAFTYHVVVRPSSFVGLNPHAPDNTLIEDHRYRFEPTPVGIHFWLHENETLESALTKLAAVYIQVKALS